MFERNDPTAEPDVRPLATSDIDTDPELGDPLEGDDPSADADGEAVVVPGQRPGPTEPTSLASSAS